MARPKIWNVHSLRAFSVHPYGCWGMWSEQLDKDKYKCYADHFTAENFDASEWAELAKEAGMKYMVLTTKHHDGFSLWYSKSCLENFNSVNYGAKKDFVKEYTDACRNAGLMVGLYYSPLDWRFSGFSCQSFLRQVPMHSENKRLISLMNLQHSMAK